MKFLLSVAAVLIAGPLMAQQPGQCMKWKYICSEKDEFGTCVAWETECLKWGPPPSEGPGRPMPGTGEGSTLMHRLTPRDVSGGVLPPFILDSMSRGVDSFVIDLEKGNIRIVNIVRNNG